jgi:aminopeptidase N
MLNKKADPTLTYSDTSNVIRFFEEYLHTNYAYKKYSQVAVDDFDFGGMENISCITLTKDYFHDISVIPDYTNYVEVVSHETAHQWFGDIVTCRD